MARDGAKRVGQKKPLRRLNAAGVRRGKRRRPRCSGRNRMSRTIALLTSAAVAALGIAVATPSYAGDIVGLVTKTNTNPFFVKMKEGFEAKAKELGLTPQAYAGKVDGDNDGEVKAIEQLIAAGAKGILLVPSDSTAIVPTVKKARDAGIIVITLDTPLDPVDAADAQVRHRQLQGRRTDRPVGQGHARRQGRKRQDRHARPDGQPADRRLSAPQRLPHRLRHHGEGSQAFRDERQPADRRLRRDPGLDRRRPQGDGEHPAEGRQDRPRLRDQRAGGLRRLRRAQGGGQGEGRDWSSRSTAAARASSGSRKASSAPPRSNIRC